VVRYPHTAIVTASAVTVTGGEYVSSDNTETTITGRLQTTGSPRKVKSDSGDWIETNRIFFTQDEKPDNADTLTVDGNVYRILTWEEKQTHSKIWLD
jgi:hypothetical protein